MYGSHGSSIRRLPFWSRKVFAATQYGCWPAGVSVLTIMTWLFGSGDWVAGSTFHTTWLPVAMAHDSWTMFLPAHWAYGVAVMRTSSPMHQFEPPVLSIRNVGPAELVPAIQNCQ